jgi:hypothetical protein
MPSSQTSDRFFDAVNESYETLLDAVRAANDRGHRISKRLIDEVNQGQRNALELGRTFAGSPLDVSGLAGATVRSLTDAQGRALDLTRQLLDELTDAGQETRDSLRRVVEANRSAGQAAVEATRDVADRAGGAIRPVLRRERTKAEPVKGQRKGKTEAGS